MSRWRRRFAAGLAALAVSLSVACGPSLETRSKRDLFKDRDVVTVSNEFVRDAENPSDYVFLDYTIKHLGDGGQTFFSGGTGTYGVGVDPREVPHPSGYELAFISKGDINDDGVEDLVISTPFRGNYALFARPDKVLHSSNTKPITIYTVRNISRPQVDELQRLNKVENVIDLNPRIIY